jgi:hypothetical protein
MQRRFQHCACIARDVTLSNMYYTTCNDNSIKIASANVWRPIDLRDWLHHSYGGDGLETR